MTTRIMHRAWRVRAESRLLRAQAIDVRQAARDTCRVGHAVSSNVAHQLERRDRASAALGTWPYWAPATSDLMTVLVVA